MANQEDVRRIAMRLPQVIEEANHFAFSVPSKGKNKGFVWAWNERVDPRKPKIPNPEVLAVRVADQAEKEALLNSGEEHFFTESHYNGFPAVLVRLPMIGVDELEELIEDAWRCQAPKAFITAWEQERREGSA
jgi:hypothetical protein